MALTHAAADVRPAALSTVHLLRGPYVTIGNRRMDVPEGSKRLLVFVAVSGGQVARRQVAGALWPEGDDVRAAGNLRSALWRLRTAGIDVLHGDKAVLRLHPRTAVDVDQLCAWAERVNDPAVPTADLTALDWRTEALNLLPGWYDDWVLFERERLRQLQMHALEAAAGKLIAIGRHADAIEAALAAVRLEPLRESANRVLILAHLAENNIVEAVRCFEGFQASLLRELGVAPTADLRRLALRGLAAVNP